jgi:S-adenosylmethionine:tRNA ribosyltransferase-isomerase
MQTSLFDFHLPEQQIAQEPLADRDAARLLVMDRAAKSWRDAQVRDLPSFLRAGDLLILNNTRVIPARLRALRDSSGGKVELLLVPGAPPAGSPTDRGGRDARAPYVSVTKRVLIKSGGKLLLGESFTLIDGPKVILRERMREAGDIVEFLCTEVEFDAYVNAHGEVPLPPYIRRAAGPSSLADKERYQTVFAREPGAVAAPTAGLHFTERVFAGLAEKGIECRYLTLHVGPGTFRPVKTDAVEEHFVDPEPYIIPAETVAAIKRAKMEGRRVIPVGTTSLRALEGALAPLAKDGWDGVRDEDLKSSTGIFIYPPYRFAVADALLTNFHIPKSSLLMLVCAIAAPQSTDGIAFIQQAYEHAVKSGYRFYSYGDACLIA